MDVRRGLEVLRRHLLLVAQATIAVGVIAAVLSSMRSPVYKASAKVLLRPPDAAGDVLGSTARRPVQSQFDADRQVIGQLEIIRSQEVVSEAAKALNIPVRTLQASLAVSQRPSSDVVLIGARNIDAATARDMANALARAYLNNRREQAVSQLRAAGKELEAKLADLQSQIARYDGEIAAQGQPSQPGQTATPEAPAPGVAAGEAAAAPPAPDGPGLNPGGQPTSVESLKAARYAAAVQYNSLFAKQQDILVQTSLKEADAELVASARTPAGPISPKPLRDGLLGAALGFALGSAWAFVRERLDDRIRSRSEIEELTGLPVLAELPREEAGADEELVAAIDPLGGFAEAVRSLRTSIDFLGLQSPIRRVVVTSPSPGDGKSRMAANLAVVYAQSGYRTVLVSADLRRSRAEKVVGADGGPGLSGAIAAMASASLDSEPAVLPDVEGMLVTTEVENLRLLPSGTPPPNPAELLRSQYADMVLDQLARVVDRIVIDTPPVIAVTDAVVLGPKADGVVLVVALEETERDAVRRARELLEGTPARVLGVVANKAAVSSRAYRYGYREEPATGTKGKGKGKGKGKARLKTKRGATRTPEPVGKSH